MDHWDLSRDHINSSNHIKLKKTHVYEGIVRSSHWGTRHRCKGEWAVKMLRKRKLNTRGIKEVLQAGPGHRDCGSESCREANQDVKFSLVRTELA